MSFPRYERYKDSGIEWLGEVPEGWNIRKISWDIPYVVGWTPSSGNDAYYGGNHPWVTIADMTEMTIVQTKSTITDLAILERKAQIVPAGSMLFSFKLSVGKVCFLSIDAYTNEAIAAFLPSDSLALDYWKYAAPEFIPVYGRENIYGALLLNQELIGSVRFYAPEKKEQTQIARFLDHETARIDALIAEQQRLITLLKEKRQAVISHAVTKGLNPTVPMKDSGVEWLGDVPKHWTTMKVKHILRCFEQGWSPQCENEPVENSKEWGVLKVGCVNGGIFSAKENKRLPESLDPIPELSVKADDVLISRANTRELVGGAALVELDHPNLMLSDKIFRLRTTNTMSANYLVFCLGTNAVRYQIELEATGASSSMLNIGQSVIKELSIPVPPKVEQHDIVSKLGGSLDRLYCLQQEAIMTQKLLQERRSALISAAVTGKIDVRNWHPSASEPTAVQPAPVLEATHGR